MNNKPLILILGLLIYLPTHYMSGLLGNWDLPSGVKSFMREGGTSSVILVDIFIVNGPMLVLYILLGFLSFQILIKKNLLNLYAFILGWFVPFLVVSLSEDLGAFFWALYREWPHVAFTALYPPLGLYIGYLFKKS